MNQALAHQTFWAPPSWFKSPQTLEIAVAFCPGGSVERPVAASGCFSSIDPAAAAAAAAGQTAVPGVFLSSSSFSSLPSVFSVLGPVSGETRCLSPGAFIKYQHVGRDVGFLRKGFLRCKIKGITSVLHERRTGTALHPQSAAPHPQPGSDKSSLLGLPGDAAGMET